MCNLDFVIRRKVAIFAQIVKSVYFTMITIPKESYEIPAVEVVDLRMDSVILQMSKMTTTDYDFGGLDESFLPVL